MSDEDIRAAERRHRETGTLDDLATLERATARAGVEHPSVRQERQGLLTRLAEAMRREADKNARTALRLINEFSRMRERRLDVEAALLSGDPYGMNSARLVDLVKWKEDEHAHLRQVGALLGRNVDVATRGRTDESRRAINTATHAERTGISTDLLFTTLLYSLRDAAENAIIAPLTDSLISVQLMSNRVGRVHFLDVITERARAQERRRETPP
jgi:hypothetical protein